MSQPPDDRQPPPSDGTPPPADPGGDAAGAPVENAPTVAWTPPPDDVPPPAEPPPSPILRADPSPPTGGWEIPSQQPPPVPAAATGWELPGAQAQVTTLRPGYVVGSTGSRFVAWLLDGLFASFLPSSLYLFVIDWRDLFQQMVDQFRFDANGRMIPNYGATYTFHNLTDIALVSLIVVGVQFLYFVGFWTSRWQRTPGMAGLKLRVVDAQTGGTLSVTQAVKRWAAMGYPLAVLAVVPVLGSAASLASFALTLFVFLSIVTDARRRGLHDKFAGSQVIRSATSGSGATVLGCILYGIILIVVWIAVASVFINIAGPTFFDLARQLPRYSS